MKKEMEEIPDELNPDLMLNTIDLCIGSGS